MTDTKWIQTPDTVCNNTTLAHADFLKAQQDAAKDPSAFWADQAREHLTWMKPFTIAQRGSFDEAIKIEWFPDGQLNVSANCLDRHLQTQADKTALIWVGDDPHDEARFTYRQLHAAVCRWANLLHARGVKKGDRVAIYLPMIPEAAMAMLACTRIGAIHAVVFAGFSAQALRDRINDTQASMVITATSGRRGGKPIPLKDIVDEALKDAPSVREVLVVQRDTETPNMQAGRDVFTAPLLAVQNDTCEPETMNAEDPLFVLYTSGSTGKPKGLLHTSGGYLLYAMTTFRVFFDYKPNDIFFCTADVGWITGHSYLVYGPLANGATTVMFEGIPTYPDASRYWDIIDRYQVTTFYTAPTALRSLMRLGDAPLNTTKRSSLRILGTVGEPINPEVWEWYFNVVGNQHCAVVDTWWQTETGGHMMAPPPSAPQMIPGSAMMPFWGVQPVLLDAQNNVVNGAGTGALFIAQPWPGMARSVWGNHARFIETYFSQASGLYCTGDGAIRDGVGNYTITGRVDDVINVSGHRFGTAEIESAIVDHMDVAEAAVIGRDHDIKGTGIYAYVTLKQGVIANDALKTAINNHVRAQIGAIASLDWVQWAPSLPKTRSGKIMRRILRKIANGEFHELGDTSTLSDPNVVDELVRGRVT
jgi:acetyl-CoA synthetase